MTLNEVRLVRLPKIPDTRGNLSFFEEMNPVPFPIKRAYWIYDVPGGESRGCHAYRTLNEFIVALSGSFDLVLHDGKSEMKVSLNRSYNGVMVPRLIWRQMENFSTNALVLIVADQVFDEQDYIRDFRAFKKIKQA